MAFVAHHLTLGADRIQLFFDDPDDPAADTLRQIDRVLVTRCTDAFWTKNGFPRAEKLQERQRRVLRRVYRSTNLDWMLHIDIDEYMQTKQPISALLERTPKDQPVVKAAPFESMYDPTLKDDLFTGRLFRGWVQDPDLRRIVFGNLAPILTGGMLSHRQGKCFFRSGVEGLVPTVHNARLNGATTNEMPFHPDLTLLHFHANEPDQWVASAHSRARSGSYSFQPMLAEHILSLDQEQLYAFFQQVHHLLPETEQLLRDNGLLVEADLHLRDKVAALRSRMAA